MADFFFERFFEDRVFADFAPAEDFECVVEAAVFLLEAVFFAGESLLESCRALAIETSTKLSISAHRALIPAFRIVVRSLRIPVCFPSALAKRKTHQNAGTVIVVDL